MNFFSVCSLKQFLCVFPSDVLTVVFVCSVISFVCFLQDMIHNEDIKLDWDFKLSLLTDLVRVS